MSLSAAPSGILRRILPRPLWARLRTARAQCRIAGYSRRVVRHLYGGFPLDIVISDPVAADWYDHDVALPPELELLGRSGLRPGARVFDLGAHQGVVALMLARLAGASGQVIAVEAVAHNARIAGENVRLNQADNLVVLHAAAADKPGMLEFEDGGGSHVSTGQGDWTSTSVEAVTVDGLAERFGPPDVLFLDVEGYEQHVLNGAPRTLESRRPDCFVEIHVGAGLETFGGTISGVLAHFPSDHYELFVRGADPDDEFRPMTPEVMNRQSRFFLVALARRNRP